MVNGKRRLVKALALMALATQAYLAGAELPGTEGDRHADRSGAWTKPRTDVLSGFRNMYHAAVLPVEDEAYPYRMWFFGWASDDCNPGHPGCDAIYHARGKDLDTWEVWAGDGRWDDTRSPGRWVPVLAPEGKPYDAWHNGDPSVVRFEGQYYMAYSATGPNRDSILFGMPGDTDGDLYCVLGAVSDDGIRWTRTEQPLVIHGPDAGKTLTGRGDEAVHGMYHRPSLMREGPRWRLWFDYWTGSDVAMGYAEAPADRFMSGGFDVLRAGDDPLLHEWPNPSVIKAGTRYYSFADPSGYGEGWPGRQVAEAVSDDGLRWRILGYLPPDPDTPACQVPEATVIRQGDEDWIVVFYACQIGGEPEYDYRYNRIRYMRRKVSGP